MIFSLDNLGLATGAYGDDFNIVRRDCFHRGKDYETNKTPTPFKAGVYGRVTDPNGGEWGTITVVPFGTEDQVQYLHCSAINVQPGDIVAPWTVIGTTGEVCPTGGCNGIHLHLQVTRSTGKPSHKCWDRNYLNPNTWTYDNPLIGHWTLHSVREWPANNIRLWETTVQFIISNDLLLTPNYAIVQDTLHVQSSVGTCTIIGKLKWKILFDAYTEKGIHFTTYGEGTEVTTIPGTAICGNPRLTQQSTEGEIVLQKDGVLKMAGSFWVGNFTKTLSPIQLTGDSSLIVNENTVEVTSGLDGVDFTSQLTCNPYELTN